MPLSNATRFILFVSLAPVIMNSPAFCQEPTNDDALAKRFIEYYEATVRPQEIDTALAYWAANVSGKDEDFAKKQAAEEKLDLLLSDRQRFAELKAIKQGRVSDPLLKRQIDVLYLGYLGKQVDPELLQKMRAKSNAVERAFNVFRAKVDGRELTDNDVRQVLRESRDSKERQAAWEASKKVGQKVVGDLRALVALRNEAARKLGFKNFHVLQLYTSEQDQAQVLKLFDQLDALTGPLYREAKAEIDAALAKNCGITVAELRPWHYHDPFFQEAPSLSDDLPESVYKALDPIKVTRDFYAGVGLPVNDVIARSDLYEKPGKNPHAFCIDVNRAGDIRVLENVVPGREWFRTSLHEFGHAAYSKYVGSGRAPLPYILHTDAHALCTEGVAMMYDRFAANADFLKAFGATITDAKQFGAAAAKLRRNRLLVFSRWCQLMFRFEMAMYDNPEQDLNRLWWDLAEKYQGVTRPEGRNEPDFASKYHLIGAPVYYHNYLLGEMFASQVHHALVAKVLPGKNPAGATYVGNKAAGQFMKDRVFGPGLSLNWNQLTRHATGAELNAKAFAEDLKVAD